jgi:uncharacterized protein (DUF1684 family)
MKYSVIAIGVLFLAACGSPVPDVEPEYRDEIELWRATRLERLKADDSWLTVVGLHWLEDGANRFGSDPENEVVLEAPGIPPLAGTLEVTGDGVVARAPAEVGATVNGEPFTESTAASDVSGKPDLFGLGRLTFFVIDRGGRIGIRVKDPESEARRHFKGIKHFPIDARYKVTATLEPYEEAKTVQIPTIIGEPSPMLAPGLLRFELNGDALSLEPYVSSLDDEFYFFVVRDRTSGATSYGGGRFLTTDAAGEDGTTTIDFNLLYNPPCAFTAYATCPLPTPQNTLGIPIEAGEKFAGH